MAAAAWRRRGGRGSLAVAAWRRQLGGAASKRHLGCWINGAALSGCEAVLCISIKNIGGTTISDHHPQIYHYHQNQRAEISTIKPSSAKKQKSLNNCIAHRNVHYKDPPRTPNAGHISAPYSRDQPQDAPKPNTLPAQVSIHSNSHAALTSTSGYQSSDLPKKHLRQPLCLRSRTPQSLPIPQRYNPDVTSLSAHPSPHHWANTSRQ
jgi:hypothetical protein